MKKINVCNFARNSFFFFFIKKTKTCSSVSWSVRYFFSGIWTYLNPSVCNHKSIFPQCQRRMFWQINLVLFIHRISPSADSVTCAESAEVLFWFLLKRLSSKESLLLCVCVCLEILQMGEEKKHAVYYFCTWYGSQSEWIFSWMCEAVCFCTYLSVNWLACTLSSVALCFCQFILQ